MGSKKPHTLGGVAYTSAGGIWEERILSLDIESVDQNLSRYFPSQKRVGVSARREKTETGTIKYFVHIPGCQEVPIGTPHQPCIIIELVKLGNQTRFIATANDQDSDRLFQLIEKLEGFLYPATIENLHHRLEPALVIEIIGRRIMSVGYTYQLENDTFIVIHEGHELGRILLSTQRPGLYFEYSMPSKTGVGERYVPRSPQDGFQPVDDNTMRFRELIHMIHEDIIGQIELNDMMGRWPSPQTGKRTGDTAVPSLSSPPPKGKQGPRKYSKAVKIAAINEWDSLDKDLNPITLEEWLDNKFGNQHGELNVKPSTFHGWRKLRQTP